MFIFELVMQEGSCLCSLWSIKKCISNCFTEWQCGWCSICCSSG